MRIKKMPIIKARSSSIISSVDLRGAPTAITAAAGTSTSQIASTAFVRNAVTDLINSSPEALDTLAELAAALGDDPNFATTVTTALGTKLALAGGTLTGSLILADDPVEALEAATKQYVDDSVAAITLNSTDDLVEGVLNLYFTEDRVRASINLVSDNTDVLSYNSVTGAFNFAWPTSDGLVEGVNNLFYTTTRVRNDISLNSDDQDILSYSSTTGGFTFNTPDTDKISEGATNLYFTTARARNTISAGANISYDSATGIISSTSAVDSVNGQTGVVVLDTDNIDEGSNNLYFTNTRVRAAVSLTSSDTNTLSYNGATGAFTYVKPDSDGIAEGSVNLFYTDARARLAITVTGDLTYNSATGVLGFSLGNHNTDDLAEGAANLYFTEARVHSAISLVTDDADILSYSAGDGEFTYVTPSTTKIAEGSNLYYTDARARAAISTTGWQISYNSGTGVITMATPTTSDVAEGTNLYYTDTRARAAVSLTSSNTSVLSYDSVTGVLNFNLSAQTTDDVAEGSTNLYFTDERVDDRVAALVVAGVGMTVSYDDPAGTLTFDTYADTDGLAEGAANLYFTETRARDAVSANDAGGDGSFSYDSATGVFTYTGPDASEVRAHFSATTSTGVTYDSATGVIALASIPNASLTNSEVTFNGVVVALGGSGTLDTDDIGEGAANLYFTEARARAVLSGAGDITYTPATGVISFSLSTKTTDDLAEGATNLYFTTARARAAISATGDLSYDSATGIIDFSESVNSVNGQTGVVVLDTDDVAEGASNLYFTTARAQAAITGGTGVDVTGGVVSIGQAVGTTDNVTFGDLTVSGDLTVNGTLTTINSTDLAVTDKNITIADGAVDAAAADGAGITVDGANATITYASGDDSWNFNKDVNVNGDLAITGSLGSTGGFVGDLTGNVTGQVSDISNHDTDALAEGSTNLYFTDARARAAISTTGWQISYNSATGVITMATPDTDDVAEGATNLYYTDTRARAAVSLVSDNTDALTYDTATGVFTFDLSSVNSDEIVEGAANLYFTTARVRQQISVSDLGGDGSLSYDNTTGVISYTGPDAAEVRAHFSATTATGVTLTDGVIALAAIPNSSLTNSSVTVNGTAISLGGSATFTTDDIGEGAINLYFTDARARAAISLTTSDSAVMSYDSATGGIDFDLTALTTDSIAEGVTNLFYTDERVDDRIGAMLTAGSNIALTYDDAAGTMTIDGPTSTTVINEGTNLYYTDARVRAAISLTTNDAGVMDYDAATGAFTFDSTGLNTDEITEGSTNLYFTAARARDSISVSGDLTYNDATGVIGFSLSNHNTDDVAEGAANLYFTEARVHSAISLTTDNTDALDYDATTGTFTFSLATVDTDEIAEGPTNFYFTTARARNALSAGSNIDYDAATGIISTQAAVWSVNTQTGDVVLDTDNIDEGSANLYFTDTRARAALTVTSDDTNVLSYNTATGVLSYVKPDTDAIAEGAVNLYYTDARWDAKFAAASVFDLSDVNSGVMTDGYTLVWSAAENAFVPQNISVTATTLNFTGDGATTSFNTQVEVASIENTTVFINGLVQAPTYSYTLSTDSETGETSIVFDSAPETNDYIMVRVTSTSQLTAGGVLNESSTIDGGTY